MLLRTTFAVAALATLAGFFPPPAAAQSPTIQVIPVNDVQVFTATDSPCSFDITFTGTGTIALTSYYDQSGAPLRQAVHGALTHTIFSAWPRLPPTGRHRCTSTSPRVRWSIRGKRLPSTCPAMESSSASPVGSRSRPTGVSSRSSATPSATPPRSALRSRPESPAVTGCGDAAAERSAAYLNLKLAVCTEPSFSFTVSCRQVPTHVLSVFQT